MPVPMQTLMDALPHILAAPRDATTVDHLTFRPGYGLRTHPDQLQMTRAGGIPNERWTTAPWLRLPDGSPDPAIQVSILPLRVYRLVCDEALHPGDPIIADLNTTEENLPIGTRLQVGTATLVVSGQFNNACVKWKARYGEAALAWVNLPGHPALRLRGILCAIESDGDVRTGDAITVLSRPS